MPARLLVAMLFAAICFSVLTAARPAYAQEAETADTADDDVIEPGVKVQEAREILKRSLPPGATREQEIRYWVERERAAFAVGSGKLRLEALRRLVEMHRGTPEVYRYWAYLWREERRSGNQQRAFEIGEEIMRSRDLSLGRRIEYAALMSDDYLAARNNRRAWQLVDEATRLLPEYAKGPDARGLDYLTASVENARSTLLRVEGRYGEAEAAIRKALVAVRAAVERTRNRKTAPDILSIYESALRYRHGIYGNYIALLATTGRHVEAEAIARQGLQDAIADQTHGSTVAYWYTRIARAKLAQRRYADAQALLERALTGYEQAGLAPSSERVVSARMSKIEALLAQEKYAEADAEYSSVLASTRDDALARELVTSSLLHATLHALNGRGDAALTTIEPSVRYRTRLYGERNPATLDAKVVRAMALHAQGNAGAALSAYRDAFDAVFSPENSYADTTAQGLRSIYMSLAWQSYLRLIAEQAVAGKASPQLVSDAFTVADRLRDSTVQQALIDSAARALVGNDPALGELVRKEQDVRTAKRDAYSAINQRFRDIGAADRDIKEAHAAEKDSAQAAAAALKDAQERRSAALQAVSALRKQIAGYDEEQRGIRQELQRRFPGYARLVNPPSVRPRDIAKQLAPDEALLSVYTTRTHTFVWAITARSDAAMHVAPVGASAIAADVRRVRATLELGNRTTPAPFNFVAAHHLYTTIFEPLQKALAGVRAITVVANDALGQIPFAVLVKQPAPGDAYESAEWLAKDFAIAHIASASAWLSVRESAGRRTATQPFVGFGDPQFSAQARETPPAFVRAVVTRSLVDAASERSSGSYDYGALPPLPDTRIEILAMAKSLNADPAKSAFFGAAATRAQVMRTNLRDYRVVAFATHGLKAGDLPDLSQPALALAATASGDSPLLTLDDVLRLQLGADWVVLSACNTAAADGGSEEAISGLGRGFFFAGARSMLVTHWAVESSSAQTLVTHIFDHYAKRPGTSRAESLRAAQLDLISGAAGGNYRHPFFWAPYALIGDGIR